MNDKEIEKEILRIREHLRYYEWTPKQKAKSDRTTKCIRCPECGRNIRPQGRGRYAKNLKWGYQCFNCGYKKIINPHLYSGTPGMTLQKLRKNKKMRNPLLGNDKW